VTDVTDEDGLKFGGVGYDEILRHSEPIGALGADGRGTQASGANRQHL